MNQNPFVLPGFGQSGPMAQNPILASMEMMRQAWEGLASGGLDAAAVGKMMSVEEMDKRISDLRAVENWLRMNLSMLTSTIQGLEVQRATIATLKSVMDTGMAQMAQHDPALAPQAAEKPRAASPLEEALGMKPAGQRQAPETAVDPTQATSSSRAEAPEQKAPQGADDAARTGVPGEPAQGTEPGAAPSVTPSELVGAAASAAQGWWNLLQQQFQTLAAATAASAEGAATSRAASGSTAKKGGAAGPGATGAARKAAAKSGAGSASSVARKTARKTAAKAASAGGAARKAASKTPAARKTARKTAG